MFLCLKSNPICHVWAIPCEMASMNGYLIQYVPDGNYVWSEKSTIDRYYRHLF